MTPPTADDMQEGLPWYSKWRQTAENPYEPRDVLYCQVYDSGIMVICQEYKGYVHEGTRLHSNLLEALEEWRKSGAPSPVLQVLGNRKGKISLGVEDEVLNHRWIRSENRYTQIRKKSEASTEEGISVNPLLAGSGVRTGRVKGDGTSTDGVESRSKGSTRLNKAG